MATLLEHPEAQALLKQATLTPEQIAACGERLSTFLQPYLELFTRCEQRHNATVLIQGRLSGLSRKTSEPIAYQAGMQRKPLQAFVGWGPWDDEVVMTRLRQHVVEVWPDPEGVFIFDGSGFPKKGTQSCGVQRQWCGRLGKVDNCQVGVFLAYACRFGHVGLDRRLFLPKEWASDPDRRAKTHVPEEVSYQEHWQIALELLDRCQAVPHRWVTADAEFGRIVQFRQELRKRDQLYVVDVPADTLVRDLQERRPPRRRKKGRKRQAPYRRVDAWTGRQPAGRWQRLTVRAGEKGPLEVEVVQTQVQPHADSKTQERLVVIRTVETKPRTWQTLSNAGPEVPLLEVVQAHAERHRGEQVFQEGKSEVGLGHYEVRGWVGWHHHMTLCLLALWFLALERGRIGGEKGGGERDAVREIFTRLLRRPPPTPEEVAQEVNRVLLRNEEARIYAWLEHAKCYPPPRRDDLVPPDTS